MQAWRSVGGEAAQRNRTDTIGQHVEECTERRRLVERPSRSTIECIEKG
jgi:hypothetical protein